MNPETPVSDLVPVAVKQLDRKQVRKFATKIIVVSVAVTAASLAAIVALNKIEIEPYED